MHKGFEILRKEVDRLSNRLESVKISISLKEEEY